MFRTILFKTLYDMRTALLGWIIGLFLLCMGVVLIYPTIQENSKVISRVITDLPPELKAFAGTTDQINYTTLQGFLQTEVFSFFLPALVLSFSIVFAANLIAAEEETGTAEILLVTQIPRWRIALEKFAALAIFTACVLLGVYAGLMFGESLTDLVGVAKKNIAAGVVNVFPLAMFFSALAFCITGFRNDRGLAIGLATALAALSYLIVTVSELADIPEWVTQLLPWYYYDSGTVLARGLQWNNILLLTGGAVLMLIAGLSGYERRDIDI